MPENIIGNLEMELTCVSDLPRALMEGPSTPSQRITSSEEPEEGNKDKDEEGDKDDGNKE